MRISPDFIQDELNDLKTHYTSVGKGHSLRIHSGDGIPNKASMFAFRLKCCGPIPCRLHGRIRPLTDGKCTTGLQRDLSGSEVHYCYQIFLTFFV